MANSFFLSVTGARQGIFKGETGKNESEIPIHGFSYEVLSPYDVNTGHVSGRRQHKPITVFKEWGVISVQLYEALVTNETLTSVIIQEMRTGQAGKEELYMQIRLTNAIVAALRIDPQRLETLPEWANMETEQVSFTFQKIEIENFVSKATAVDDWAI